MESVKLLRDQFAMAALQGELASQSAEVGEITNKPESLAANAKRCYAIADAMIAASGTPDPRIAAAQGLADALKAFLEAWDKSHQLEKTDVARRMAEVALEAWEKLQ